MVGIDFFISFELCSFVLRCRCVGDMPVIRIHVNCSEHYKLNDFSIYYLPIQYYESSHCMKRIVVVVCISYFYR